MASPALAALAAAVLAAGPALAATPAADTPMATADANAKVPAPPSVADQIDAYLKSSPGLAIPGDGPDGVVVGDEPLPRKVHGVASVAIGTGGYRSAYVRTDLPVGRTGTVSIALQDTRFNGGGYGYGHAYGGPYGGYGGRRSVGLSLGADRDGRQCHTAWNDGRPPGFSPPPGEDRGVCNRAD